MLMLNHNTSMSLELELPKNWTVIDAEAAKQAPAGGILLMVAHDCIRPKATPRKEIELYLFHSPYSESYGGKIHAPIFDVRDHRVERWNSTLLTIKSEPQEGYIQLPNSQIIDRKDRICGSGVFISDPQKLTAMGQHIEYPSFEITRTGEKYVKKKIPSVCVYAPVGADSQRYIPVVCRAVEKHVR
jgi:hypothetical protein